MAHKSGRVAALPCARYHAASPVAHDPLGAAREKHTRRRLTDMDLELTLDAREAYGKANKRLRRTGMVPGVVYGKGHESTPVQVESKVFDTLYRAAGRTSVIKFHLPGEGRATSGLIKSVQRHPLSGNAVHVDFFLVNLRQEMELDVPLVFIGDSPAVVDGGGTLLHSMSQVHVKALPNDIPQQIEVNVATLLNFDVAIHVRDLNLNRDLVHVLTDGDALVAMVVPPRQEEEPETVAAESEEGAELAEGAEEGQEGEHVTRAEGDAKDDGPRGDSQSGEGSKES